MKRIVALFFLIIFTTLSAEVIEPELTEKNFTIGQKFQIPVDIKPGDLTGIHGFHGIPNDC